MADGMPLSMLVIIDEADDRDVDPIEAFAAIYYALRDAGARLLIASACGGYPWRRRSKPGRPRSAVVDRFLADRQAREEIADTLRFRDVFVEDFAGGVLIGGASSLQDDGSPVGGMARRFLEAGKPVAAVSDEAGIVPGASASGLIRVASGGPGLSAGVGALLAAARGWEARGKP